MGWLDRLRGWSLDGLRRPWGDRPSIYQHLRESLDPKSGRLSERGKHLPDDASGDVTRPRWAAGARDGVAGHHVQAGDTSARAKAMVKAIEAIGAAAGESTLGELYALTTPEPILPLVDAIADDLRRSPGLRPDRIAALGRLFAREAADREAVKLGVALLGMLRGSDDRELLTVLAAHDELTLYAVVALVNQNEDAELLVWQVAKTVDGWGRIHAVERLAGARRPEVRAWLLREGFRNAVMNEYLAYVCATAGQLHVALAADAVDEPLLRGATGLLFALASPGPAKDLADYEHAADAVGHWVRHIEARSADLELPEVHEALDALAERDELPPELKARIEALKDASAASR